MNLSNEHHAAWFMRNFFNIKNCERRNLLGCIQCNMQLISNMMQKCINDWLRCFNWHFFINSHGYISELHRFFISRSLLRRRSWIQLEQHLPLVQLHGDNLSTYPSIMLFLIPALFSGIKKWSVFAAHKVDLSSKVF